MSVKKMFIICMILCAVLSIQMACASDVDDSILIQNVTPVDGSDLSLTSPQDILRAGGEGSFAELAGELSGGGLVTLQKNYSYAIGSDDYVDGIPITADTTIMAEGDIVINAKNQARIFNIASGASVTLNGITFIGGHSSGNGGAIYTKGSLTITNCNFNANSADNGGAIYYDNSQTSSIVGSAFAGNQATSGGAVYSTGRFFEVIGTRFTGNGANQYGGSLYLDVGAYVNHCVFTGEHVGLDGGSIYLNITDLSSVIGFADKLGVYNSSFISCHADRDGGAGYVYSNYGTVDNVTFTACSAGRDGGAGYVYGSYGTLINSRFIANNATSGKGGAVLWAGTHGTLRHTNMTANNASDGGAIYLEGSDGTVEDLMCFANVATNNGGSVYIAGSNYGVTLSSFTASNATKNGGAIYITGDYVNVTHSTLDKCSALEENGGAIYASGINATISNSNFTMNRINFKSGRGGSIDIEGDGAKILNAIFDRCSAWEGGVVYVNGSYVTIDGYSCNRSFANNCGGAIYILGDYVTISNFNISNTNATNDGGAIYVEGNFANIANSNFTRCISDHGNGAALYIVGLNATVFESHFVQNKVNLRNGSGGSIDIEGDGAKILSSTFMMCTAADGGVAYVEGANVTIDGIVCERSFAANGGAFYVAGDNVTISNADVSLTNATDYGGAVYVDGNFANITDSNFTMCISYDYDGGAIYIKGVNATISETSFAMNRANGTVSRGGSINIQGDYTHILNCDFDRCIAYEGGVIYVNGSYAEISGYSCNRSLALNDGGAIYIAGDYVSVSDFTITNTNATCNGGALYVTGDHVNVTDSTFARCISYVGDGGCIFVSGLDALIANSTFSQNRVVGPNARGGSIDIVGDGARILSSNFTMCTAVDGGVAYVEGANVTIDGIVCERSFAANGGAFYVAGDNVTISNADVSLTNATDYGGAVYVDGNFANITDSNFTMCISYDYDGGAIYIKGVNATISETSFAMNRANGTVSRGGSIDIEGDYAHISHCDFDRCTAYEGGVIYVKGSYVEIDGYSCNRSLALNDGGAIYIAGDYVSVSDFTITNTNATNDGGALYVTGNHVNVTDSTFARCIAYNGDGGCIFVSGLDALIANSTFSQNRVTGENARGGSIDVLGDGTRIIECDFDHCTAWEGGVIYVEGSNVIINHTTALYTNALNDGGGIYIAGNHVTVDDLKGWFNNATNAGGTIYVEGNDAKIHNAEIRFTTALLGSGIYVDGEDAVINESTFSNNNASGPAGGAGGSIYVEGSGVVIANSGFSRTHAVNYGGSIYVAGNNSNITGATFEMSNVDKYNGGAIYVKGVNTTISYSNFSQNAVNASNWAKGGSIDIEGDNTTIEYCLFTKCNAWDGGVIYVSGENVVIDHSGFNMSLAVNNGGAIYVKGVNATISNSDLGMNNATNYGGAIYVEGDFANITCDTFEKCIAYRMNGGAIFVFGHNATIEKSSFAMNKVNESTGARGGAIDVKGDGAHIIDSNFTKCTAYDGGVIYINGKNVVIDYSIFNMSFAVNNGGAIYVNGTNATISNSNLSMNNATNYGGAIYIAGDFANISGDTFQMCIAYKMNGGAIFVSGDNATIEKSSFAMNKVNESTGARGGAIDVKGDGAHIIDSNFTKCTAYDGGVIYISGEDVVIDYSIFNMSFAVNNGGAIYVNGTNATISNSDLSMNNATNYGGAIYIAGDFANITGDTFQMCIAYKMNGGAIFVSGDNATIEKSSFAMNKVNETAGARGGAIDVKGDGAHILDSNFTKCLAYEGGVIYVSGDEVVIDNSIITMSAASNDGGAVYIAGDNAVISNSDLSKNNATNYGGAVYVSGHNTNITNDNFTMCIAYKYNGGAIYIRGINATIEKSNFSMNMVNASNWAHGGSINVDGDNATIKDSVFDKCTAWDGGVIYVGGDYVVVDNVTITRSFAVDDGGAIYIAGDYGTITNSDISMNNATNFGGAIYVEGHNTNITYTNFTMCIAYVYHGGAIFVWGENTTIDHADFLMCKAVGAESRGGAIDVHGANTNITNSEFDMCHATDLGGAIYVDGSDVLIEESSFNRSTANRGGAIYILGHYAEILNSNITYSNATVSGGGLYLEGYFANITGANFEYCFAITGDGGAVYISGNNATMLDSHFNITRSIRGDGGAIYITGNHTDIFDSTFDRCGAVNGGIIYVEGSDTDITGEFTNSNSQYDGGALYILGEDCDVSNSTFINNVAIDDGGAIYWQGNGGSIYNITCVNNKAPSLGSLTDEHVSSSKGGTICLTGNDVNVTKAIFNQSYAGVDGGAMFITGNNVDVTASEFYNCHVNLTRLDPENDHYGGAIYIIGNNTDVVDCIFDDCYSILGGTMYIVGHNTTVEGSLMNNSYSVTDGGAIFVAGDNATISGDFMNCNASTDLLGAPAGNGGAIYVEGKNTDIVDSTFTDCFAKNDGNGGAIYILGRNTTVERSAFNDTRTTDEGLGGAIFILGNDATVNESTFNLANAKNGGAIYIDEGLNTNVLGSNFTKCGAIEEGGAIYIDGDNAVVQGCTFNDTIAGSDAHALFDEDFNVTAYEKGLTGKGGAIYIKSENAQILDSVIESSYSTQDGGAIYVEGNNATISVDFINCAVGYPSAWVSPNRNLFNPMIQDALSAVEGLIAYNDGYNGFTDDLTYVYDTLSLIRSDYVNKLNKNGVINSENLHSAINGLTELNNAIPSMVTDTVLLEKLDLSNEIALLSAIPDDGAYSTYRNDITTVYNSLNTKRNYANNYIYERLKSIRDNLLNKIFVNRVLQPGMRDATIGNLTEFYDCIRILDHDDGSYPDLRAAITQIISNLSSIPDDGTYNMYNPIISKARNSINALMDKYTVTDYKGVKNNYTVYKSTLQPIRDDLIKLSNQVDLKNFNKVVEDIMGYLNQTNECLDVLLGVYKNKDGFDELVNNITVLNSNIRFIHERSEGLENIGIKGGAIYVAGNDTNITDSSFVNCFATDALKGEGGAIYITGVNTTIAGAEFIDCAAPDNGGCIYIDGKNARIESSSFDTTSADVGGAIYIVGNFTTIADSNFTEATAKNGYGGAIYIDGAFTNVTDSSFVECESKGASNVGGRGGAIYIKNIGTSVSWSNFTLCHAESYGGAIYIDGINTAIDYCNVQNNSAPTAGAIHVSGNDTILSFNNFTHNQATSGQGGSLSIGGTNASLFYSSFEFNTATGEGGAIRWEGGHGHNSIVGCNFTNNTSHSSSAGGGAIFWTASVNNGPITSGGSIRDSIFINNTAYRHGGAIDWYSAKDSYFDNCTFINNHAHSDGGAIYSGHTTGGSSNLTISNSRFYNNTAEKHGGAISNQMSDSLIVNNTFDGNMANNAGADILMKDTGDPARNTVIDNCNFSNSKTMLYASSYGGDGASIMINNKNITIQNCNFVNTTVYKQNGGAIAIKSTDCKIINVTITNSSTLNGEGGAIFASSGANNIIINNVNITNAHSESEDAGKDANGGAIYCAAPNANIILVRIVNATSLYNFTDGGKSAHGGAIYFSNTGTMSNITVINSSASAANGKALGGAVYRTNGNLYHALFINNTVETDGGAVYWDTDNAGDFYDITFISNSANRGGALFWNSNKGLSNLTFINNSANDGGALYWVKNNVVVDESNFINNTAARGGAAFVVGSYGKIQNSEFTGNLANETGGAIYYLNADINANDYSIINSSITHNNATRGSAIYVNNSKYALDNVILLDNQAHSNTFAEKTKGNISDETFYFEVTFLANDNLLNAIWQDESSAAYRFTNVEYLGLNGQRLITDDVPTPSDREVGQNVTIELYDENAVLKDTETLITDADGKIRYVYADPDALHSSFRIYHFEDNYYTYLGEEFTDVTVVTIVVDDIYHGENATANVTLRDGLNHTLSGNVTIKINDTFTAILEVINGTASINNISGLAPGFYNATVRFEGNETYIPSSNWDTFRVIPVVNLTIIKYSNWTSNGKIGDLVNFTIIVTHNGYTNATGVNVTDILPAGLKYISSGSNITGVTGINVTLSNGSDKVVWTIGDFNSGSVARLWVVCMVMTNGTFINVATVNSTESKTVTSNRTNITADPVVDLKINKTVNVTRGYIGDSVKYAINITNDGPCNATGVYVYDRLSDLLEYVSFDSSRQGLVYDNDTGIFYIGDLNVHDYVVLTIFAKIRTNGTIENWANVTGDRYDTNTSNNNDTADNITALPVTNLTIVKYANATTVNVTDLVKFTIVVTNNGPSNATMVVITDALIPEFEFNSTDGVYDPITRTVTWTIPFLANGTSESVEVVVRALTNGTFTNVVGVVSKQNTTGSRNETNVTVKPIVDLIINKTVNATDVNVTDYIKYIINVTNKGPSNATNVYAYDKLSDLLEFISFDSSRPGITYDNVTGEITIGRLNVNESVVLTIVAKVIGNGTIPNWANITGRENDTDTSNNNDSSDNVTAHPIVDLRLNKTVNVTDVNVTDLVTYTINITNKGPCNATDVVVWDKLDDLLEFVSFDSSRHGSTYDYVSGKVTVGALNVNETVRLTIVAKVIGNGTIPNRANITSYENDTNSSNNNDTSDNVTAHPIVDLRLNKTVNVADVNVTDLITYTINITNKGPCNATDVVVWDKLDGLLEFVSFDSSRHGITYDHVSGKVTVGALNVNETVRLTIVAKVKGNGTIPNRANITSYENDTNSSNNNDTSDNVTAHPIVDLRLNKTVNVADVNVTDLVTYTINITNKGPCNATDVVVWDKLDGLLEFVSFDSSRHGITYDHVSGKVTVGALNVNETVRLTIVAKVKGNGTIPNRANITSYENDTNSSNNNDTSDNVTAHPIVDLRLNKTVNVTDVNVTDLITYTINITNKGPCNATYVVVYDKLDDLLEFVSFDSSRQGITYDAATGRVTVGTLNVNETVRLTIVAKVKGNGTIPNRANITSYENDTNSSNNNDTSDNVTAHPIVDLRLNKTVNVADVNVTDLVTYTINITNKGPCNATDVVVWDKLDDLLEFVSFDSSRQGITYDPVSGKVTVGNLAVNETIKLTIVAKVIGNGTIPNRANITSYENDTNSSNNNDTSDNVTAHPIVDLRLNKTVSVTDVNVTDLITYTINITNKGPCNATYVVVYDKLDDLLEFVSFDSSRQGINYDYVSGKITVGTLNVNETVRLTIVAKVIGNGTIPNRANITSYENDTNSSNNNDTSDNVTAHPIVDLRLNKTVSVTDVNVTDLVTYTINITNKGPCNATDVVVWDKLDDLLEFVSFDSSRAGINYDAATGKITVCTLNVNETVRLTIVAKVIGNGTIPNSANITSYENDTNSSNNNDSSDNVTAHPIVDLRLNKTVDVTDVNVTDLVTYTINITNKGPCNATDVFVYDKLSDLLEFESFTSSRAGITYDAATGKITVGTLNVNETVKLTIVAKVINNGTIANKANITSYENDTNSSNNNDTSDNVTAHPIVDLMLNKTVNTTDVNVTDYIAYTIDITNKGPCNATDVVVWDKLDDLLEFSSFESSRAGITYDSVSGKVTVGNLAVNETVRLTIVAKVINNGTIMNKANITSYENDTNSSNNNDTSDNVTAHPIVDLRLNKTVDVTDVNVTDLVTYTINITNKGPCNATDVVVWDKLDDLLEFVSFESSRAGITYDAATGKVTVGTLNVNETVKLTIVAKVINNGTIPNRVNITSYENDTNSSNNNDSSDNVTAHPIVDLVINKTVNTTVANISDLIKFTITVTNKGPSNATDVVVTEILSDHVKLVEIGAVSKYGSSYNIKTGKWSIPRLDVNDTATLTIIVEVMRSGIIINTANVTSYENDTNSSNNNASSDNVTVNVDVRLEINKTVNTTVANVSDLIKYTITVTNYGKDNATDVMAWDKLSDLLEFKSFDSTRTGITYDEKTGKIVIGTLRPNESVNLTIVAKVIANGTIANVANVTCHENKSDNDSSDNVTAHPVVDLRINKTVDVTDVNVTDYITYTIDIVNKGSSNATDVVVWDKLSDLLEFTSFESSRAGITYDPVTGKVTVGYLNVNETVVLIIVAKVFSNGTIPNKANITSYENDTNSSNNNDTSDNVTSHAIVDLRINKTVNVTDVNVTDYIKYTIDIVNKGPCNATDVVVWDKLSDLLEFVSFESSRAGITYDAATGKVNVGNLAVNETVELTIVAKVVKNGTIENAANITSHENDTNSSNNNDTSDNVTSHAIVDLGINKTVNVTDVNVSDYIKYTIDIVNNGPSNATDVVVWDKLSDLLEFVSFESSRAGITYDAATGKVTVGNLAVNETIELTIIAKVIKNGTIENAANITSHENDTNSSNNNNTSDNVTAHPVVDLRINKTVNATDVNVSDYIKYTIDIVNKGPSNATDVVVWDKLSDLLEFTSFESSRAGITYDAATGKVTVGNLAVNETVELTIIAKVVKNGTIENAANITSHENDTDPSNNNGTSDNVTSHAIVDLGINKTVNATDVNVSDYIKYTIDIVNKGPCNATDVVVWDKLSDLLEFVSFDSSRAGIIYDAATGKVTVGNLNVNETVVLTIIAKVVKNGTIENAANITGHENDTNSSNNNGTSDNVTSHAIVDLRINKTVNATDVNVTDYIKYTITIANNGPSNATDVVVWDKLSDLLEFVSFDSSRSRIIYDAATGRVTVGNLAVNETIELTIIAKVIKNGTIENAANITGHENDTDPSNNNGTSDNVTAHPIVDLSINKTVNATDVNVTDLIKYTITIANNGPSNATDVVVWDKLSDLLEFSSFASSRAGITYDPATGKVTVGNLAVNETIGLTIIAKVIKNGTIENAANITGHENDTNPSNNNGTSDNVTAHPIVDLSINKTSKTSTSTNVVSVGDVIVYTISVHNYGPSDATEVIVNEALSELVEAIGITATAGTYDPAAGIWNIGTLANGSSATLTIRVKVIGNGTIVNVVNVTSGENDTNKSNNNASSDNITALPNVVLYINKTVNVTEVNVGDYVKYQIIVANYGLSNATDVYVMDKLDNLLEFISFDASRGDITYDSLTGRVTISRLAVDETVELTIVAKVISNGTIENTAVVTSNETDPSSDSSENVTSHPVVDVSINKTVSTTSARIGDEITYVITVHNYGPSNATNVRVTEKLSEYVSLVKATPERGSYDESTGIWYIAKLENGETLTLTLTVKINTAETIENSVSVNSTENDTDPYNNNYTSDNVTADKLDTPIILIPQDITYGDDEIITVILPDNATGTVNITVNGKEYNDLPIRNGTVILVIPDLAGGDYNVTVVYGGDKIYVANSTDGRFNVAKAVPIITIEVVDIWHGEIEVLNVTVNAPGTVNITVFGITIEVPLNNSVTSTDVLRAAIKEAYKGRATWNLINLPVGRYPAFAIYNENENYTSVNTSDVFYVRDKPSTVVAIADDIYVGEDAIVNVQVGPKGVTGNVTLVVDGVTYELNITEDGKASVTVSGLTAGLKDVYVRYNGDILYRPSENVTTFNVLKLTPPVSIDSPDITVGEDGVITVTVPSDATGTITIEIGGRTYTQEIVNGTAVFVVPGLSEGEHDITAYYSGDDRYLPANATGTIKVNPVNENRTSNDTVKSCDAQVGLSKYPTGNPILALLLMLVSVGIVQIRRFKR